MPSTFTIVMIVILIVLIAACIALYFFGKRAEKRQAEQQEQMDAAAQTVSMLVIDKKKMKLKEAGLPAVVLENTPKYLRRTKVPVVKAKIGPRIMTLMCDNKVFEVIPVKKKRSKSRSQRTLHNRDQERKRRIYRAAAEEKERILPPE